MQFFNTDSFCNIIPLNLDIDLAKKITFIGIILAIFKNFPLILNVVNFTTKSYYFSYFLIGLITSKFIRVCLK